MVKLKRKEIKERIIKLAKENYNEEYNTGLKPKDLKKFKKYPHFFVISCLMDRQIKAENAWSIPYIIETELKTPDIQEWYKYSQEDIYNIFSNKTKHRFKHHMSEVFYEAVKKIVDEYDGNAALIWKNAENCADVICRFLEFKGCGIKIATMAVNILTRVMGVKLEHKESIDISPDSQVRKVMLNLGLIDKEATREIILYRARDIYPKFPGILDPFFWKIGKNYCIPKRKRCADCPINDLCLNKEVSI